MFAEHLVITPTIVDINLEPGNQGSAYLFRDGQMVPIKWSTPSQSRGSFLPLP